MIEIRTAQRKQSKLRIGLSSPSGGGKTYSGLLMAKGLAGEWEKVGLIDSENGRGEFYSDFGPYKVIPLKAPFTPESYIEAIRAFEKAGVEVIVIDSVTHEWDGEGGCLQINDKLAQAKYRGNTWSAWSETTPRHQRFLDAITSSDAHVITTVRNKIETAFVDGKVKKVGIKEIQREGFEYELTVNFNIDRDSHTVLASKDNTRLFEGKDPFVITEETGKILKEWVESGAADKTAAEKKGLRDQIKTLATKCGFTQQQIEKKYGLLNNQDINELNDLLSKLEKFRAKQKGQDPVSAAVAKSAEKHQ